MAPIPSSPNPATGVAIVYPGRDFATPPRALWVSKPGTVSLAFDDGVGGELVIDMGLLTAGTVIPVACCKRVRFNDTTATVVAFL